jgi:hypothetical protein
LIANVAKCAIAGAAVFAAVLVGPVAGAGAAPPIWEPNFGAELAEASKADDIAQEVELGSFAFPFYGVTHTGAEKLFVSSNGLLQFGPGGLPDDHDPNGNKAREGAPKIAALWADLNPANEFGPEKVDLGAVYENTFNEDADPAIDRLVFTWNAPFFGCEKTPSTCRTLMQVQLFDTGRIVFGYNGVLTNQAVDDFGGVSIMPVIAQGGFVNPPGFVPPATGVDFSEAVPFTGGSLIFESFASQPIRFDLDQNNLVFVPSAGGYQVSSTVPFARLPEAGSPANKADKKAPKVKLKGAKQDLAKALSKGLKLQINCNEACFAEITVAGMKPKLKKAGSGVAELTKKGKKTVTVKLNKAAHDALARAHSATFKVRAVVFDEAGNKKKVSSTVKAK